MKNKLLLCVLSAFLAAIFMYALTRQQVSTYVDSGWNVVCYYRIATIDCIPLKDLGVDY